MKGGGLPVRFALRYAPAVLACEFKNEAGELHTIKIEFRNLTSNTDAAELMDMAKERLGEVLAMDKVDDGQLQNLVLKLAAEAGDAADAASAASAAAAGGVQEELPADLRAAMGLDDDDDDGGKVADRPAPASSSKPADDDKSSKKMPAAKIKRSDTEGFDDLLDDLLADDIDAPLDKSEISDVRSSSSRGGTSGSGNARASVPAPAPEPEEEEEEDLNKVSDFRLRMAKKRMDEDFEKNLVRPGMEGYEYDKAVEFGEGEEDLSWDDD